MSGELDAALEARIDRVMLWPMMKFAAPLIAGKPCLVKRREPTTKNSWGVTSLNMDGTPVITLSPYLVEQGEREYLRIYLHELAHVKLHTSILRRSTSDIEPPSSKDPPSIEIYEIEANNQVSEWLKYGEANRDLKEPYALGIIYALIKKYQNQ